MNAVDGIIQRAHAKIAEFEAHVEKHRALIERAEERDERNHSWWLNSLTDEEEQALDAYRDLQVQASVAKRTLEFWGAQA